MFGEMDTAAKLRKVTSGAPRSSRHPPSPFDLLLYNPWPHIVYTARGNDVTHTVIAGQIVVADGCLRTVNGANAIAAALKVGRLIKPI